MNENLAGSYGVDSTMSLQLLIALMWSFKQHIMLVADTVVLTIHLMDHSYKNIIQLHNQKEHLVQDSTNLKTEELLANQINPRL